MNPRCRLAYQHIQQIGNLFDADFRLMESPGLCSAASECGGCDRDKVTIELCTTLP